MLTLARSMFDFVITVVKHQWCCENWQDKQKVIIFVDLNEWLTTKTPATEDCAAYSKQDVYTQEAQVAHVVGVSLTNREPCIILK